MTTARSAREQFPALASQAAVYEDTLATLSGEYDQSHVQASNALNLIDRLQTEVAEWENADYDIATTVAAYQAKQAGQGPWPT